MGLAEAAAWRCFPARKAEYDEDDARLRAVTAVTAAPAAIELEVRRMEAEAKKRIAGMRTALARNPEEASFI